MDQTIVPPNHVLSANSCFFVKGSSSSYPVHWSSYVGSIESGRCLGFILSSLALLLISASGLALEEFVHSDGLLAPRERHSSELQLESARVCSVHMLDNLEVSRQPALFTGVQSIEQTLLSPSPRYSKYSIMFCPYL